MKAIFFVLIIADCGKDAVDCSKVSDRNGIAYLLDEKIHLLHELKIGSTTLRSER